MLISILSLYCYIQSLRHDHYMYTKYPFPSISPPHLPVTQTVVVRLQLLKRASCARIQHATSYFSPYTHQLNITPFSHSESLLSAASLRLRYSCTWSPRGLLIYRDRVAAGNTCRMVVVARPAASANRHATSTKCLSTETLHRARTRFAYADTADIPCFLVL